MLNGEIIKDCLINPGTMETSLLSEGILGLFEGWSFHLDWKGKEVIMPDGSQHWAWREGTGVLCYVPAEMLPDRHGKIIQEEVEQEELELARLDYEIDQLDQLEDLERKKREYNGQDEERGSYGAREANLNYEIEQLDLLYDMEVMIQGYDDKSGKLET